MARDVRYLMLTFIGCFAVLMYQMVALVHLESNPLRWPTFDQAAYVAVMACLGLMVAVAFGIGKD
jgi:hypothetical protein